MGVFQDHINFDGTWPFDIEELAEWKEGGAWVSLWQLTEVETICIRRNHVHQDEEVSVDHVIKRMRSLLFRNKRKGALTR